jgi:hypothetical protein
METFWIIERVELWPSFTLWTVWNIIDRKATTTLCAHESRFAGTGVSAKTGGFEPWVTRSTA